MRDMNNSDREAARELFLYAENDGVLYHRYFAPVYNNLQRKFNRGIFNPDLAARAFIGAVRESAKKYAREFAYQDEWPTIFSVTSRQAVCRMFVDRFIADAKINRDTVY